jgi:hypothetical protein
VDWGDKQGSDGGGHTVRFPVAAGVVEEGAGLAVELVAVAGGGAGMVEDVAVVLALFNTSVVGLQSECIHLFLSF